MVRTERTSSSENQYPGLFEEAPTPIIVTDSSGRILRVNSALEKLTGYGAEILQGTKPPFPWWPKRERETYSIAFQNALKNGARNEELCFLHKDGQVFWVQLSSARIILDGLPVYVSYWVDITHRKQLERSNLEHEQRLGSMFLHAGVGVTCVGLDGVIREANPAMARMVGYEPADLLGMRVADISHPEDYVIDHAQFEELLRSEVNSYQMEKRYMTRDGDIVWGELNVSLVRDENGKPRFTVGVVRDITERKRAQRLLVESENRYRTLVETASDAIFVADPKTGMMLDANRKAEELLGYTKSEICLMHQSQLHPKEQEQHVRSSFDTATRVQGTRFCDVLVQHKDGTHIPVEISSGGVVMAGGRPVHFGIFRDMRERYAAQEALKESERRARRMFEQDPIPTFALRSEGDQLVCRAYNKAAADSVGERIEKLIGMPATEFWKDCPDMFEDAVRCLRTGESVRKTTEHTTLMVGWRGIFVLTYGYVPPDTVILHAEDISAQTRVEAALRESEARYRELFENISNGVVVYEPVDDGRDFMIKQVNDAGCKIARRSRQDLIGQTVLQVFPGVTTIGLLDTLRSVYRSGGQYHLPARKYEDENVVAWVENDVYRLPSGEIVAIYNDVTRRIEAEIATIESERLYRLLFDVAGDFVFVHTLPSPYDDGRFVQVNKKTQEIFGYSREEFLQLSLGDLMSEPQRELCIRERKSLIENSAQIFDRELLTRSGKMIHCEVNARIIDYEGQTAVLSIARDITERKEAQANLLKGRRILAEAGRMAHLGGWDFDIKAQMFELTDEHCRIYGLSKSRLSMQELFPIVHPDDLPAVQAAFDHVFSGRDPYVLEYRIIRQTDKAVRHIVAHGEAVEWDEEDKPVRIIGAAQDVTERKQVEFELAKHRLHLEELVEQRTQELERSQEQLRRSERLASLGTLASGIAHEINNPIGGILLSAQMVCIEKDLSTSLRQTIGEIINHANRCKKIIQNIRRFARSEETPKTQGELISCIRRAIYRLERRAAAQGVRIQLRGVGRYSCMLNETGMEQVFFNLISNSLDAGAQTVTVDVTYLATRLRCDVLDDGGGLKEEQVGKLFDPFYTTRLSDGGMGLGLSIAHGIVRDHGGSIEALQSLEGGTVIRVELPAVGGT